MAGSSGDVGLSRGGPECGEKERRRRGDRERSQTKGKRNGRGDALGGGEAKRRLPGRLWCGGERMVVVGVVISGGGGCGGGAVLALFTLWLLVQARMGTIERGGHQMWAWSRVGGGHSRRGRGEQTKGRGSVESRRRREGDVCVGGGESGAGRRGQPTDRYTERVFAFALVDASLLVASLRGGPVMVAFALA